MAVTRPVMVYQRPWNARQFQDLAEGVWPGVPQIAVSEHRAQDAAGFVVAFYAAEKRLLPEGFPKHLTEAEIDDVILRCRLLRALPPPRARKLVLAAEEAIEEVFDKHCPRAMLSITADSYILHLFVLASARRRIPFIGLVPTFLNNRFRITSLGERVAARQTTVDEVATFARNLLSLDYKPDFLAKSPKSVRGNAQKLWRRNLIKPAYFALRRRFSGDPLNYHDWSTELVARRYWSLQLQKYLGQPVKTRSDLPLHLRGRPLVFLPLQMSPEATVDYWSHDTRWIDYEARVLELLDIHADRYCILIKEHPNLLGFRSPGFYKRLRARPNAVLVNPSEASNAILELCDAVLLCTGTVGFEAALRGVPVYSDSRPFHLPPDFLHPLDALTARLVPRGTDSECQFSLLRHVLEGVLPGHFVNDGTWNAALHDQTQMITSLRAALGTTPGGADWSQRSS